MQIAISEKGKSLMQSFPKDQKQALHYQIFIAYTKYTQNSNHVIMLHCKNIFMHSMLLQLIGQSMCSSRVWCLHERICPAEVSVLSGELEICSHHISFSLCMQESKSLSIRFTFCINYCSPMRRETYGILYDNSRPAFCILIKLCVFLLSLKQHTPAAGIHAKDLHEIKDVS